MSDLEKRIYNGEDLTESELSSAVLDEDGSRQLNLWNEVLLFR